MARRNIEKAVDQVKQAAVEAATEAVAVVRKGVARVQTAVDKRSKARGGIRKAATRAVSRIRAKAVKAKTAVKRRLAAKRPSTKRTRRTRA